ncbi:MAG: hypothetical protein ACRDQ2_14490 [Gaiellales bacterium]
MRDLILFVAVLACPVVMGAMMLVMWRGMRGSRARSRNGVEE